MNRIRKGLSIFGTGLLLTGLTACASSQPTPELVDARRAYQQTAQGPAARYVPDRVLEAKNALERAEAVHEEEPGSVLEQHYAYLAERAARQAAAYGQIQQARAKIEQANLQYDQVQNELRQDAQARLETTREALERTQRNLDEVSEALAKRDGAVGDLERRKQELEQRREELQRTLAAEREARLQAEQAAAAAIASLEEVAKVKEENNELVITLTGAVLFKTAESELLPIARQKLDTVAAALKQQDENKEIVVEGHTDSRGATDMNQRLSLDRAQAVRSYLVSQGVDADRVSAVGMGESEPIAENTTAEGRANNRRVEIIVRDKK